MSTRLDQWAFADTLSDGIYGVDPQGRCSFINTAALRLLGYGSADELVGRNMHDLIHHTRPDGTPFPAAACPLLHTLTSGRPVRLDNEVLWRKDGTSFIAEYSSFPLFEAGPAPSGSVITFKDRTSVAGGQSATQQPIESLWGSVERRRAEEALRESETRFRTLADSMAQLAWMTGPDGAINWYNRRWYEYTGTTPDEMTGWGWKNVHHPDHIERVVAHISESFATGTPWEDTFPLRGKDGQYRWFLSRALPIRGLPEAGETKGRLIGWLGTNTDINDLREAEEQLNAAMQAAEEANKAKSEFIANMSHELRTPLSAIIGYSEMMQEEIGDGADGAELTPDLQKIEGNARHLLGLINDVLDLSKIESGKMEVFAETFDVAVMARDVASTVQNLMAKKGNELVVRLEPRLGSMQSDITKLRQILLNLLGNASKFTEGGTVTLSVMRLPGGSGGDWLVFRVADTGIGMTEEQLGRLFQRFSQADASTTRKFGGTGLGLSISKAFGVMLGGDLSVDSAQGQGSTFSVFLPAVLIDPNAAASGDPAPSTAVGPDDVLLADGSTLPIVLVIDDDPGQRDLMIRFLGREGFRACTAADGATGLELARSLHPKAILLDVTMPGLDGWSVLSALKADPDVSDIPVIMVTFVDERGLAASLGAADYVMKPVKWESFRQVMERYRDSEGSVLVVEDDQDMRHHMRSVLERDGWSVVEAGDGRAALERVAEAVPRVVLLDLEMPVMDGFAFLRAFRTAAGCAEVPVVVLTARDLTREDRKRLQGATEVLNKGVTSLAALSRELKAVTQAADAEKRQLA
ncbi:response regulator [Lichenifustis flavocetrariae]|uniref:histidine kinase n=1 Tax=Lichenifustis flavocetrariae TaxID=2949735 RepID=A0AA41Z0C4_9HYPH|nr:PAS domain-containing hybrid sensor histidine kinase/response regulator [Lichenifustis flavocetrariae]MCW6510423.1 response regulator [Lichenifustis flavocetrariae]